VKEIEIDITRREFLKRALFGVGAVFLLPYTKSIEKEIPPNPDAKFFAEKCRKLLSSPSFFTKPQGENTKLIITNQLDSKEYERLSGREISHNMTCTLAVIATIKKMCSFLYTDIVPDTTIADISNVLDGKSFIDVRGYESKYGKDSMVFVGLPDALNYFVPPSVISTEFLTPNYGARYATWVSQRGWLVALEKGQEICENGGFTIIHCIKHGANHAVLATDIKDDTAIVVDSFSATAERVRFSEYFEFPRPVNMIGVTLRPKELDIVSVKRLN